MQFNCTRDSLIFLQPHLYFKDVIKSQMTPLLLEISKKKKYCKWADISDVLLKIISQVQLYHKDNFNSGALLAMLEIYVIKN